MWYCFRLSVFLTYPLRRGNGQGQTFKWVISYWTLKKTERYSWQLPELCSDPDQQTNALSALQWGGSVNWSNLLVVHSACTACCLLIDHEKDAETSTDSVLDEEVLQNKQKRHHRWNVSYLLDTISAITFLSYLPRLMQVSVLSWTGGVWYKT